MDPQVKVYHLWEIINRSFDLPSLTQGSGIGQEGVASVPFKSPGTSCHCTPPPVLHSCWARPKTLNCSVAVAGGGPWVGEVPQGIG